MHMRLVAVLVTVRVAVRIKETECVDRRGLVDILRGGHDRDFFGLFPFFFTLSRITVIDIASLLAGRFTFSVSTIS